mmetsp:Transcript_44405/g.78080  ORF Transcript_44405/g.78080 Transcript_44405/m.78080 type:complete len:394 (-) Transcript_44405:53-1234(-)
MTSKKPPARRASFHHQERGGDPFDRQESAATNATSASDERVFNEQEARQSSMGIYFQAFESFKALDFGWKIRVLLPGCLMALGCGFLKVNEGWSILTTAYVMVQIVTTIGYGDITVENESSMLFMTLFSLALLILVALNINIVIQKFFEIETRVVTSVLKDVEDHLEQSNGDPHNNHVPFNKLVSAICITGSLAIFGTVFFATYEACSCSVDVSRVQGCTSTSYKACAATGGITKSWIEALYLVVMSFTTIGFGDFSIQSRLGRIIGTVWMLTSVASMGNLIAAISGYAAQQRTLHELLEREMDNDGKEVFDRIDKDQSGTLSRSEFIHFTLIRYALISEEVITTIEKEYERLDTTGEEKVTREMIVQAIEDRAERRARAKAKALQRRRHSVH